MTSQFETTFGCVTSWAGSHNVILMFSDFDLILKEIYVMELNRIGPLAYLSLSTIYCWIKVRCLNLKFGLYYSFSTIEITVWRVKFKPNISTNLSKRNLKSFKPFKGLPAVSDLFLCPTIVLFQWLTAAWHSSNNDKDMK